MAEKKIQPNPQQGLGDQVCENTCQKNGDCGFRTPNGICQSYCAFNNDRDQKRANHFVVKRQIAKTINPITRPIPAKAHRHMMMSRNMG